MVMALKLLFVSFYSFYILRMRGFGMLSVLSRKSILPFTTLFLLVFVASSADAIIAKLQESETKDNNFSANVGDIINMDIYINTMGNQLAGVFIFLSFDDKYFELIDAKPAKKGIQPVEDGPFVNWQIMEEDTHADPGNSIPKFQIDYAEATFSQQNTKAGDGVIGTIHLRAIKPVASTEIVFDNSKFHNRVTECTRLSGNGQFQSVKFTQLTTAIISIKGGPQIIKEISDVTLLLGQTDASVDLDDYVDDANTPDSDISWKAEGDVNIIVSIGQASHVVTFRAPSDWTGSETITLTASDPEGSSTSAEVGVHVKSAPKIEKLPDVSFLVGETSYPVRLNNFVSDMDNPDLKDIKWTYSGQTNVKVELNGHIVTFSGDGVWVGSETITFTATDADGYSENAEMIVSIRPETTGPIVSDIPDIIATNDGILSTLNLDLDDYVYDFDNNSDELVWSVADNVNVDVIIDDTTHEVTFKSLGWIGTEKITFTVIDPDSQSGSDTSMVTLISEKAEPIVLDIPDITFSAGTTDTNLNLNEYVIDLNGSPDEITWTYKNNDKISINIAPNNVATFTADEQAVELITFTAMDADGNQASDPMNATSVAPQPPGIADLPDVKILQGEARKIFNLDDFVSDDDTPKDNINWRTLSYDEEHLTISIGTDRAVLLVASKDWYGTETVTFIASDEEGSEASKECQIKVTVAPVVTLSGEITIAEGETDASLELDEHIDDADTPKEQILWEPSESDKLEIDVDATSHEVVIHAPEGSAEDGHTGTVTTVVFTAIDPDGNKGEGSIKVRITEKSGEDTSPVVKDIPDVVLSAAKPTAEINLNDYVHDDDTPPDKITWTASGNTEVEVTIEPSVNRAILTFQEGSTGEEDVTFTAVDPDGNEGSDTIKVTVLDNPPDDKSPLVFGIPDVIIPKGATDSSINLGDYVADSDNPAETLTYEYSGNVNIEITIDEKSHQVTLKGKEGFLGSEDITFTAIDPEGNKGSDTIKVTVRLKPDTTPPTFEVFAIHNPIQPDYVDIIIISSEMLKSIPRVTVKLANNRRTLSLAEIGENIWKGRYIAPTDASGKAEISVTGTDLAGNKGSEDSKTFTVGVQNPAAPTLDFPTFLEMHTYPNPAKQIDKLTVQCKIDGQANLTVKIYDIRGRLITTLYNEQFEKQGNSSIYECQWNMRNDLGDKVASGIYFGFAEATNGEVSLASLWKLAIIR